MDRVLTDDPRMKRMEDLVHDLSTALEESSRSVTTRRRWGMRRRARSTGNLPECVGRPGSEASSDHGSDSDENPRRPLAPFSLAARHLQGNLESDSLNENFSPAHPNTRSACCRRKRKLKRMDTGLDAPSTSACASASANPGANLGANISAKKKRVLRHTACADNRLGGFLCGKRKRSLRERSLECASAGDGRVRQRSLCLPAQDADLSMDCTDGTAQGDLMSSSSLSSSESDNGIYTNDEGREGDDEQSDWIGEGGGGGTGRPWWEEGETGSDSEDETLQKLLHCHVNDTDAQRTLFRQPRASREIRSGRRRVGSERPGFSILTSANEKLSRFLQDPAQSRLRLHAMQRREREQLAHLAHLYSLELTSIGACPILTKTLGTPRAEPLALGRLRPSHAGTKRRRGLLAPPTFNPAPGQHLLSTSPGSRPMLWESGPSNVSPRHKPHPLGYKSS